MGHIFADVIFVLACIGFVFVYAKRGFIKSAMHFLKTLLAVVVAYLLGSKLGAFLCDKFIGGAVREFVYEKISAMYANATSGLQAEAILDAFPQFLRTEEVMNALAAGEGSGEQMINTATDAISAPIATVISNVIGYIAVFVIALIAFWIAAILLTKLVERISILGRINTLLGGLLGLLVAIVILFAVASLIKLFFANSALYADSVIVKMFGESALLNKIKILNFGSLGL